MNDSNLSIGPTEHLRSDGQHRFYARPRLRHWSTFWFAMSIASLARFGLPRRGHRLFGNMVSFW